MPDPEQPLSQACAAPSRRSSAGQRCVVLLAVAVVFSTAVIWEVSSRSRSAPQWPLLSNEGGPHALLAAARAYVDIAVPHVLPFAQQDNIVTDGSFDVLSPADSPWTAVGAGFSVTPRLGRSGSFTPRARAPSCSVLRRSGSAVQSIRLPFQSTRQTEVLFMVWSRPHGGPARKKTRLGVATMTLRDGAGREVAVAEVNLAPATAKDWHPSWALVDANTTFDKIYICLQAGAEHEVRVDDVRVTIGTSQRERAGIAALIATFSDTMTQETLGARWECGANQCSGRRFFQVWSTHPSTFTVIQLRSIESILRHHPNACVCVYAEELPVWWFSELWYYGHNVRVGRPSPEMISQRIPVAAPWAARIREWRKGRNWYAHYADWLRLALLYLYGGTYTDTDYVFLRELGSDGEPSTNTTCTNAGGAITGTPPWSVVDPAVISRHTGYNAKDPGFALNNAFLSFDKGNKFLVYALEHISKIYRPRCWDCHGPRTVTHIYKTRLAEILARSDPDLTCVPSRVGRLQPTSWTRSRDYVIFPQDELFAEVVRSSTAVHLWNRAFETEKLANASFAHRLLERSRITLFHLDS